MARTESLSTSPDPRCDIIPIEAVGQRRAYRGIAQPFAAHAHDHYVIGLVEDGRRRLVCNDREYLLAPGDLFVFNPGDVHGCTQASEAWFAFDSITIAKEIFNSTALQGPVIKDMLTVRAFKNACTALDSGDGSAFADALVWAIYSLLVKRIADIGYETIASTKRTFFWGLVIIVPATLLFGGAFPSPSASLEPLNAGNLLFLGAIASAACFVTWGVSVKHLGATRSTTYIYLVPAITAAASVIILGEPFTPPIVAGIALTIGGLILSQGR